MTKRDYYVYIHKTKISGTTFYVGHGRGKRAFKQSSRNKAWSAIAQMEDGYDVVFLHENLTKDAATDIENEYLNFPKTDWKLTNKNPAQVVIPLSKEELEKYFYIDKTSPSGLRWKKSLSRKNKTGDVAGNLFMYWKVGFKNKLLRVHRIIATLYFGDFDPQLVVNHKDCNPSNNAIENLELITQEENSNKTKQQINLVPRTDSVTKITGITKTTNSPYAVTFVVRWKDTDGSNRCKKFNTNKYSSEEEALQAAKSFKEQLKEIYGIY